jgi:hypothetical protein
MNDLNALRDEVRRLHNCEAVHGTTLPVMELADGALRWNGAVEFFHLKGHPTATGCYAWMQRSEAGDWQRFAILKAPPIASATDAVRFAFAPEGN